MAVRLDGLVHGIPNPQGVRDPRSDVTLCGLPIPEGAAFFRSSYTCERCKAISRRAFVDGWEAWEKRLTPRERQKMVDEEAETERDKR